MLKRRTNGVNNKQVHISNNRKKNCPKVCLCNNYSRALKDQTISFKFIIIKMKIHKSFNQHGFWTAQNVITQVHPVDNFKQINNIYGSKLCDYNITRCRLK